MTRAGPAAAFALLLALAVLAAGCGGGDDSGSETSGVTATSEWADGFCTAITSWTDALQEATSGLTDTSSLSRQSLEDTANQVKEATQGLVSDLRDLGAPDTESGQEVKSAIDQLADTLDAEVGDIEETVQGISGLADIPGAVSSLSASFKAMSDAFSSTMEALENADAKGELQTAFESSPSCDKLTF